MMVLGFMEYVCGVPVQPNWQAWVAVAAVLQFFAAAVLAVVTVWYARKTRDMAADVSKQSTTMAEQSATMKEQTVALREQVSTMKGQMALTEREFEINYRPLIYVAPASLRTMVQWFTKGVPASDVQAVLDELNPKVINVGKAPVDVRLTELLLDGSLVWSDDDALPDVRNLLPSKTLQFKVPSTRATRPRLFSPELGDISNLTIRVILRYGHLGAGDLSYQLTLEASLRPPTRFTAASNSSSVHEGLWKQRYDLVVTEPQTDPDEILPHKSQN
ncbi:MAG: hypothetical protein ABIH23_22550 [bacterium]